MVPGVTMRTTLRSTGPLRSQGRLSVHRWQQTHPDSPVSPVVFYRVGGIPAIGMGSPADAPRLSARCRAAAMRVWHRHKTAHKIAHTIEQQDFRMLCLQLQILLHHGV